MYFDTGRDHDNIRATGDEDSLQCRPTGIHAIAMIVALKYIAIAQLSEEISDFLLFLLLLLSLSSLLLLLWLQWLLDTFRAYQPSQWLVERSFNNSSTYSHRIIFPHQLWKIIAMISQNRRGSHFIMLIVYYAYCTAALDHISLVSFSHVESKSFVAIFPTHIC